MVPTAHSASSRLLTVVTMALVLLALYFAKAVLLPFALALLLTFVLTPAIRRLERHRVPRVLAVVSVVLVAFAVIGCVGWLVTDHLVKLSGKLPEYKGNLISKIRVVQGATRGRLEEAQETIEEIGKELSEEADGSESDGSESTVQNGEARPGASMEAERPPGLWQHLLGTRPVEGVTGMPSPKEEAMAVKVVSLPLSPLKQIREWLGPLVAPFTTAGLVVVLAIFMLIQREDLRNRIIHLVGTPHLRATTEALDEATDRVSRFLRMQLTVNAIYGTFIGCGLHLIGVPNALLWGVLGLLLRFLPYVGPWLAAAMPIALSLAVFDDWWHVVLTIGLFVLLELIVNNVFEPWLYGASMGVSAIGIIVAAIFWTWLWGPVGLILAMPLTVCLVVLGNYVPQLKFLTILLGEQSTMATEVRLYQRLLALDDEEADRIVQAHLKEKSVEKLYDDVLIPALCLAERDRHDGSLSEEQQAFVVDTTRNLIRELAENDSSGAPVSDTPPDGRDKTAREAVTDARILCIPARDEADEIAAEMLSQMLHTRGFPAETRSAEWLAGELVEHASDGGADIVVISALPPAATRHTRYLCKRLVSRIADLPIVVGLWSESSLDEPRLQLTDAGARSVVTSLEDAVREVSTLANRLLLRRESSRRVDLPHSDGDLSQPASQVSREA